ncbi:MAG: folate-binding protein [Planctomycetota bacterium]|nr:MAG: folate-binding protein [Planctomycetota bacterium]
MSLPLKSDQEAIAQYEALTRRAGLVDLGHRTQIELAGGDRTTFLHNLCTADIKRLPLGAGTEAFVTSVQGKTLAHVFVFATPDTLVLDTVADQGETLLKHLDHYLITEDVTLTDRSNERRELLLAGPEAEAVLSKACDVEVGEPRLSHSLAEVAGQAVWVRRVDLTRPGGFLLSVPVAAADAFTATLVESGAVACGLAAFEAARIEAGVPWFGKDITDANLPQEVGRDALAINFVKGCYLGQETVARIDALGHVNKMLVGLRFSGSDVPPPGTALTSGDATVGSVTSASYSPALSAPLALGYVRRGHNDVGGRLTSDLGEVEIVALPLD